MLYFLLLFAFSTGLFTALAKVFRGGKREFFLTRVVFLYNDFLPSLLFSGVLMDRGMSFDAEFKDMGKTRRFGMGGIFGIVSIHEGLA